MIPASRRAWSKLDTYTGPSGPDSPKRLDSRDV